MDDYSGNQSPARLERVVPVIFEHMHAPGSAHAFDLPKSIIQISDKHPITMSKSYCNPYVNGAQEWHSNKLAKVIAIISTPAALFARTRTHHACTHARAGACLLTPYSFMRVHPPPCSLTGTGGTKCFGCNGEGKMLIAKEDLVGPNAGARSSRGPRR